jgi:hypothetical protein
MTLSNMPPNSSSKVIVVRTDCLRLRSLARFWIKAQLIISFAFESGRKSKAMLKGMTTG